MTPSSNFQGGLGAGGNAAASGSGGAASRAAAARLSFVTSGALARLQEVRARRAEGLSEAARVHLAAICACFPEGVHDYYDPNTSILKQLKAAAVV